jgi:hypothetical protein
VGAKVGVEVGAGVNVKVGLGVKVAVEAAAGAACIWNMIGKKMHKYEVFTG